VWPLDFRSYLLEAEHDAPVTAAALSPSGLAAAAGCEDGSLGALDLAARRYSTALRSHRGRVNAVAPHPWRWGEGQGGG
jgi:WD repeat-containing protein 90